VKRIAVVIVALVLAACTGPTTEDEARLDTLTHDPVIANGPPAGALDQDWHFSASNRFERNEVRQIWTLGRHEVNRFLQHYAATAVEAGWTLPTVDCLNNTITLVGSMDHDDWTATLIVTSYGQSRRADVNLVADWSDLAYAPDDHEPTDLTRTCAGDRTTA
jgi:hypothetical protein